MFKWTMLLHVNVLNKENLVFAGVAVEASSDDTLLPGDIINRSSQSS